MHEQLTKDNAKKKFSFYENFSGRYHKVGEIRDLIPQFKAFYYSEKRKDPSRSAIKIINDFNKHIAPLTFFPWEKQYRFWRKKWDAELLAEQGYKEESRQVRQLVQLSDEQKVVIVPSGEDLEIGTKTLAGELMNDAFEILKGDQKDSEGFTADELVKRRNYVLNVYNYVTKSVHSKESLNLKSNAEKRETVGFLMNILRQAVAGKITDDEMKILRDSVVNKRES